MKKRFTALLMALCLMLTLLPVQTLASSPNTAYANDPDAAQMIAPQNIGPDEAAVENDLFEKMSNRVSTIKLIDDIELNGTLPIDYEVTIDLNGHVLKMIGSGSVLKVENGGHLTLTDSDPTAVHKFTPNPDGPWVLNETDGTEIVLGGSIAGGNAEYGGGVYVDDGGQFTMLGGNIVGCTARGKDAYGGGVFVSAGGTFDMTGGSITGCTAVATASGGYACGGGIRNDSIWQGDVGHTTLSGTAEIRDCHAKGGDRQYGGGISDGGTLKISGDVQIIGCTADGTSDAMYINKNNDNSSVTGGTFYGSIEDRGNKISGLIVTYQVNGKDYATQVVPSVNSATLLDPAKQGYALDGWYKADGTRLDAATAVTESLTLTGWLYAPVTNEQELTNALANSSIDVIRLTDGITLPAGSTEIKVTPGRNVTLDLNGHVLNLGGKYILVEHGDSYNYTRLTIMDSDPAAEHKFKDDGTGLWVLDANGDKLVKGGVITGGSNTSGGAMVVDWWATVTMNGGNIVGCSASESGGAVYSTSNFSFTMNGGSIVGCKAVNGSAIHLKGSTMNANGGTVNGTVLVDTKDGNKGTIGGRGSTSFNDLIINKDAKATFSRAHSPLGIVENKPGAGSDTYHTVTFALNGGTMDYTERYFLDGQQISDQIKPKAQTGYTFAGWYNGENKWDHATNTVTGDMTLTARWTRSHTNHCVCGGTSDVKHKHDVNTVWTAWTSTDSLPRDTGHYYLTGNVVLPADSDYVLDYYDESSETLHCPDLCLNGYTVSFAAGGSDRKIVLENISTTQITDCQSAAGKIEPALQLADSGFGWFRVFNVTLAGGVENNGRAVGMYLYSGTVMNGITGTHADIYNGTVTGGILLSGSIGLHGSPNIDRLTLVDDEEAASPGYITRSSKLDTGVRIPITTQPLPTGQTPYELGEKMENDLSGNLVPDTGYAVQFDADSKTLTLAKATYTVTIDPGASGTGDGQSLTKYHDETLTLPGAIFTRDGYTQIGWATADGGSKVYELNGSCTANEAAALYPAWQLDTYTITYDLNGGTVTGNPATYTVESAAITLTAPTREGYRFIGWSGTGLTGRNNLTVTIPAGSTGHRTYTANWRDITPPTGTITMGDSSWSGFDSTAETLYRNTDQTLTVTAADNSGNVDISWLLTDQELTQSQMGGLLFGEYTAPIVLREEGSHILYVMLVDPAINITYLRSARIVIDKTAPVLDLTDGKTYCGAQTVTITELHLKSVTVNGKAVTVDADQRFTLPAAGKQTIVVTDLAGNSTTVTVTVNAGHTWGAWTSNGDDTHTRKCTIPGCTAGVETEKCAGGKADCCHKAVCSTCKAAYGKVDPNNHHGLKHVKADRATTTSYGNIEYWYCEGCGRYFKDAACTIQITEEATRISPRSSSGGTDDSKNGKNDKDKQGVKSSDTGDSGLNLWVTLLLTSAVLGGAVIVTGKRRRTR